MLVLIHPREAAEEVISALGLGSYELWDLSQKHPSEFVRDDGHSENVVVLMVDSPKVRINDARFVCHYFTLTKNPKVLVDEDEEVRETLLKSGYVKLACKDVEELKQRLEEIDGQG